MANFGKHVEVPIRPVAETAYSLVPAPAAAPAFVLRLEGLPATPARLAAMRRRVDEINRQFQQSEVPVRLRVM